MVPTFREAAQQTFEANRPRWRNANVERNWMQQLERHCFPILGDMGVDMIGREEVLRVLTPIWSAKPEAARKLRQRIRATLRWAEAHGYVEFNVAGEGISGALPTVPAVREHFRALPYAAVASALETVEASGASMAAKLCLRFVVLTAARSGEGRGATWEEIDVDTRVWRISARRMKSGGEHRVPLSDAVLAILEQARLLRDESELVFASASRPGQPMNDMTLIKVLRATNLAERAATSRQLHHSRGHDPPVTTCTLACRPIGRKAPTPDAGRRWYGYPRRCNSTHCSPHRHNIWIDADACLRWWRESGRRAICL